MKNFWLILKKYHSYLWLVAALAYANVGAPDMVTPMIVFFLIDDLFDKVEDDIKSYKKDNKSIS